VSACFPILTMCHGLGGFNYPRSPLREIPGQPPRSGELFLVLGHQQPRVHLPPPPFHNTPPCLPHLLLGLEVSSYLGGLHHGGEFVLVLT